MLYSRLQVKSFYVAVLFFLSLPMLLNSEISVIDSQANFSQKSKKNKSWNQNKSWEKKGKKVIVQAEEPSTPPVEPSTPPVEPSTPPVNPVKPSTSEAMTQIEAQMSLPWIQEKIKKTYNIQEHQKMIDQMNENARSRLDTHYDFYHAQNPAFRIVQDVYKEMYQFFAVSARLQYFTFLRFNDPMFDKYQDIDSFLRDEFARRGFIDDNRQDTKGYILSVNLSPFGNVGLPGEATFDYFVAGISHFDPSFLLQDLFTKYELNAKFIPQLKELGDLIQTPEGSLFQIFVPKDIIDKVGYIAWRHGIPFDAQMIDELFGNIFAPNDLVSEQLASIESAYLGNLKLIKGKVDEMLQNINSGKYRIGKILEAYRTNPRSVKSLNSLQARLLLSNEFILNPKSGVEMIRYTTLPYDQMIAYKKKLSRLMNSIILDWLENQINNPSDKILPGEMGRLKNLLNFMQEGGSLSDGGISSGTILSHIRMLQELKAKAAEREKQRAADEAAQE